MIFKTLAAGSPSASGKLMPAPFGVPQVHCAVCGSTLYCPPDVLLVRCACGTIKVPYTEPDFKLALQVALIKATQKALDMAHVQANALELKPQMFAALPEPDIEVVPPYPKTEHPGYFYFDEPDITITNMKPFQWQHYTQSVTFAVDPAAPTKVKKETVKLDGLTPALQEFFKDYIE